MSTKVKEFKVGQVWITRAGDHVTINRISKDSSLDWPVTGSNSVLYALDGKEWPSAESKSDLISLYADMAVSQDKPFISTDDMITPSLDDVKQVIEEDNAAALEMYNKDFTGHKTVGYGHLEEPTEALCVSDDSDYTDKQVPIKEELRILTGVNGWTVMTHTEYKIGKVWVFNNPCRLAEFLVNHLTTEGE